MKLRDMKGIYMNHELNSTTAPVQNGLPNKLLLTIGEVSEALSISRAMVRKLARTGQMKITHIGRCARISQEEVLRLCSSETLGGGK